MINIYSPSEWNNLSEEEKQFLKSKEITIEDESFIIVTDDPDLKKSNRLFKKVSNHYEEIVDFFRSNESEKLKTYNHSLKKIHTKIFQELDTLVPDDMLKQGKSYQEQVKLISDHNKDSFEDLMTSLFFLKRRAQEMQNHLVANEVLQLGQKYKKTLLPHQLRRVVLIGLGAFTESFDEKNIKVVVRIPEDITYDFDYKTFNAGLFNLLDNVQKYANQYSEFKIVFFDNSLKFHTTSIRIDKEELEKIFEMNYRGTYVRDNTKGEGVGMYTSKKLFSMNNIDISASSDYSTQEKLNGEKYCLNTFNLSFNTK